MRKLVLFILLLSITNVFAQDIPKIQQEIDQKLWKPFKEAFETLDGTALNSLYTQQVLRVTPKGIDTKNDFKDENLKRFESNKNSNTGIQLDFWFDSRQTNSNTSYEVGFYRMKLSNPKETKTIYGQFHIVLKKENELWKITQDWDTTTINGEPITAKDFENQKPFLFK